MASTATGRIVTPTDQLTSMATRPLYHPQVGQTTCGCFTLPQRGQVLRAGASSCQAAARWLRDFDFDFFFLGPAIAPDLSRASRTRLAAGGGTGNGVPVHRPLHRPRC